LPILLSLAVFPGWTRTLLASGLFVGLELVTNSVLEPLLYGHSTGISQVALLVAVLFWTWLWGPVGLLLSTP
jgi:predicted PurR-regulated permease PerM